jgi:hypothetical protein
MNNKRTAMTIHVVSERQVFQEAAQVLIKHMSPAKAARFWASWQIGEGDYLVIREQLFEKETVKSLYKKIEGFRGRKPRNRQASWKSARRCECFPLIFAYYRGS